jgi:hypothetical protein
MMIHTIDSNSGVLDGYICPVGVVDDGRKTDSSDGEVRDAWMAEFRDGNNG